jgi:hypothetical protein
MAKFRKKPVVIEAEQWFPGKKIEGVIEDNTILLEFSDKSWEPPRQKSICAFINTLEGQMIVTERDWIITGVNGEKYPCKPDIFEKTYEKVEE